MHARAPREHVRGRARPRERALLVRLEDVHHSGTQLAASPLLAAAQAGRVDRQRQAAEHAEEDEADQEAERGANDAHAPRPEP